MHRQGVGEVEQRGVRTRRDGVTVVIGSELDDVGVDARRVARVVLLYSWPASTEASTSVMLPAPPTLKGLALLRGFGFWTGAPAGSPLFFLPAAAAVINASRGNTHPIRSRTRSRLPATATVQHFA